MRILPFYFFCPLFNITYFATVPAEIVVNTLYVGIIVRGGIDVVVAADRHCVAAGIFTFCQVVQHLRKRDSLFERRINLVMQSPDKDAGVVVVLPYQLLHLLHGILGFVSGYFIYKGYLRPDQQSNAVAF